MDEEENVDVIVIKEEVDLDSWNNEEFHPFNEQGHWVVEVKQEEPQAQAPNISQIDQTSKSAGFWKVKLQREPEIDLMSLYYVKKYKPRPIRPSRIPLIPDLKPFSNKTQSRKSSQHNLKSKSISAFAIYSGWNDAKPYANPSKCKICAKSFEHPNNLKIHLYSHMTPDEKSIVESSWEFVCQFYLRSRKGLLRTKSRKLANFVDNSVQRNKSPPLKVGRNVFQIFYEFLHNNEFPPNIIKSFGVKEFKELIQLVLQFCDEEQISPIYDKLIALHSASKLGKVAMQLKLPELETKASDMINKNAEDLIMTEDFLELDSDSLMQMLKSDDLCCDELHLFNAVVRWTENAELKLLKKRGRKPNTAPVSLPPWEKFNEIFKLVRFPLISASNIAESIYQKNILPDKEYVELLRYASATNKPDYATFSTKPRGTDARNEDEISESLTARTESGFDSDSDIEISEVKVEVEQIVEADVVEVVTRRFSQPVKLFSCPSNSSSNSTTHDDQPLPPPKRRRKVNKTGFPNVKKKKKSVAKPETAQQSSSKNNLVINFRESEAGHGSRRLENFCQPPEHSSMKFSLLAKPEDASQPVVKFENPSPPSTTPRVVKTPSKFKTINSNITKFSSPNLTQTKTDQLTLQRSCPTALPNDASAEDSPAQLNIVNTPITLPFKNNYLPAGLFSDFFKFSDPYHAERSGHKRPQNVLLPPPCFEKENGTETEIVDFVLPYDIWCFGIIDNAEYKTAEARLQIEEGADAQA